MPFPEGFVPDSSEWPKIAAKMEVPLYELEAIFNESKPTRLLDLFNIARGQGFFLAVYWQDTNTDFVAITPKSFLSTVGAEFSSYRKDMGFSLDEVAKMACVESSKIQALEKGRLNATMKLITRLCNTYDLTLIFELIRP